MQELERTIELIESIDPETWAILMTQARNEAITFLILALVVGVLSLISFRKMKSLSEPDLIPPLWLIIIILWLGAFGFLVTSIMWFVNPEFYALRFLLENR